MYVCTYVRMRQLKCAAFLIVDQQPAATITGFKTLPQSRTFAGHFSRLVGKWPVTDLLSPAICMYVHACNSIGTHIHKHPQLVNITSPTTLKEFTVTMYTHTHSASHTLSCTWGMYQGSSLCNRPDKTLHAHRAQSQEMSSVVLPFPREWSGLLGSDLLGQCWADSGEKQRTRCPQFTERGTLQGQWRLLIVLMHRLVSYNILNTVLEGQRDYYTNWTHKRD